MTSRIAVADEVRKAVRRVEAEIGREVASARQSSGTSQREAGGRVDMSHAQLGRIERAEIEHLTIEQAALACAAVGLRLITRAVPDADPALDSGQLATFNRLRAELPPRTPVRTEVPLPLPGDRRAWDAVISLEGGDLPVEIEARLRDIQALNRRCALKRRDAGVSVMILVVADTDWNRRMLRLHREDLRASFPLDTRAVMRALRAGRTPEASGIVVL